MGGYHRLGQRNWPRYYDQASRMLGVTDVPAPHHRWTTRSPRSPRTWASATPSG